MLSSQVLARGPLLSFVGFSGLEFMFPPLFKKIFEKFYGSGAFGKTEAAVGTANQVAMAAQGTG
jgi:hypothetical protein